MNSKIITADQLTGIAREMRARDKRLVFTNGCFDLLHVGHVRYLVAARELGDALAVALNGDASVRALKGARRPLNNESDRATVLAALQSVDYVVVFQQMRVTELLQAVCPAIYVKGGDYTPETLAAEERAVLQQCRSEIRIVPFHAGYSTTRLIDRLQR